MLTSTLQRPSSGGLQPPARPALCTHRRQRCTAPTRTCSASTAATTVDEAPVTLRLELPTTDAQSGLRFAALRSGRGMAVVVESVLAGSTAEAAGVRAGQQLLEVSDPLRDTETWALTDRVSLRHVRDAIRMRYAGTITLALSSYPIPEWTVAGGGGAAAQPSADGAPLGDPSSDDDSRSLLEAIAATASGSESGGESAPGSGSGGGRMTIAEKLEAQHAQQAQLALNTQRQAATALQARLQRRQAYMAEVGSRNDAPFFAVVAAFFLLPAAVILLIASSSGYLDALAAGALKN